MSSPSIDVPVGVPVYGIGFGAAFKRFWKGYVVFQGRSSRGEFWWPQLGVGIISLAVSVVVVTIWIVALIGVASMDRPDPGAIVGVTVVPWIVILLLTLPMILPTYAVASRRLRDAGYSPWLLLLGLAGLSIVVWVLCALPTRPDHPYGQAPYGQPVGYGQPVAYGQPSPYSQPDPYAQPAQRQPPHQQ